MIKYEVGKEFPYSEYKANVEEGPIIMFTSGLFDILFFSDSPDEDKAVFTKGSMRYGVFEKSSIPFFIVDFPKHFNFDVSMNINAMDQSKVDKWLNSKHNQITLFLIHSRTNIIYGIRSIIINHLTAELIRDICKKQDSEYAGPDEVNRVIDHIIATISTDQMINQANMHNLK